MAEGQQDVEIVNIIFLRNAVNARKLCLNKSYVDPSYLTPESLSKGGQFVVTCMMHS